MPVHDHAQLPDVAADLPEVISGANPLVTAANRILDLVPQIRVTARHPNPPALREFLIEQIKSFEIQARQSGIGTETIIGARYCLCTVLDETAAQTPWGGSGAWSRHSLLVTFHNETSGGEKFFQLLSKLAQNPQLHHDLLELMYYCMAMGFEGRFRIVDNGRPQLETVKQRLLTILTSTRESLGAPLSPHWKGAEARKQKSWMFLPVWVAACVAGAVGLAIYLFLSFKLERISDDLSAAINKLRLPPVVVAAQPADKKTAPQRLARFFEPEIREGLVAVRDESDRSVVTLRGDGLFAPAATAVMDRYVPVLARIGDALKQVQGDVIVNGYTDSTPIRTLKFPSNWHLSQARADAVASLLAARLGTPQRIKSTGRGADDPIAGNDSAPDRAKNRRVEITLMVAATTPAQ
ncbi:MAG: DotU family type VI secretion system protein [Herminiimonas sp.]|nr:DotU family type VI secretion system protein [Herminiimonas sp.]